MPELYLNETRLFGQPTRTQKSASYYLFHTGATRLFVINKVQVLSYFTKIVAVRQHRQPKLVSMR